MLPQLARPQITMSMSPSPRSRKVRVPIECSFEHSHDALPRSQAGIHSLQSDNYIAVSVIMDLPMHVQLQLAELKLHRAVHALPYSRNFLAREGLRAIILTARPARHGSNVISG